MVSIIKRKKGNGHYYYMTYHSGKNQYERYLGKHIPKGIDTVKKEFDEQMYQKETVPLLEKIHFEYARQMDITDKKIIQSENHEFKIHHIYSTQKIEGSTMTLGQTKNLLEYDLSPKDTATEHIIEAKQMEKIFDELLVTKMDISKKLILRWHDILFAKTDTNNAGSFRRVDVAPYGGKTEYVLWPDVILKLDDLLKWYRKNGKKMNTVIIAAIFHSRFELIHPFIDGNGRIGRLLILLILHRNGYPMMDIVPKEKITYIKKLETSQIRDEHGIFAKWFVSKYLRKNKKYLS